MMKNEKNVNIVRAMSLYKLLSVSCMVVALNACVGQTPEWTESDEKWWNQSETFPNHVVTVSTVNKEMESKPTANQLKEPVVAESTVIKSKPVNVEQKKDIIEIKKEGQDVKLIKSEKAANEMAILADTALKAEIDTGIMHFPAEHFTVQLLASVDMESVDRFVSKHQVPKSFVVTTEKDNEVWYVLLLGVYDNYELAVLARDDIANRMNSKPWIRKIGSVQRIMKK